MTDPPRDPEAEAPADMAGERRLARPPSERYRETSTADAPSATSSEATADPSRLRGLAFGSVAALAGAATVVVFGGALAVSAGLLVVAAGIGYAVGLATISGAGGSISTGARSWLAAALGGLGVVLGQVGLWLYARAEGGVLPPVDYLAQTFGPLVPIELLLAAAVAWWRAR